MPLVIPPSANYPSPLNALPTKLRRPPPESDKMIQLEIDWGTMGNSVSFNLADNATLAFSQLVSMVIDNSQCGADIQFTFPDTGDIVTIPAYSPRVIVPVFTNQLFFYASIVGGESEDVTRAQLLNFVPPPIAVPTSQEQEVAVFNNIASNVAGSQTLLANTISGTVEAVTVVSNIVASAGQGGVQTFLIEDSTALVIAGGQASFGNGGQNTFVPVNNTNMRVRFQGGLTITWTSVSLQAPSALSVSIYYRTP